MYNLILISMQQTYLFKKIWKRIYMIWQSWGLDASLYTYMDSLSQIWRLWQLWPYCHNGHSCHRRHSWSRLLIWVSKEASGPQDCSLWSWFCLNNEFWGQNLKIHAEIFSFIKLGNPLYILALNYPKFGLISRTARHLIFVPTSFKYFCGWISGAC